MWFYEPLTWRIVYLHEYHIQFSITIYLLQLWNKWESQTWAFLRSFTLQIFKISSSIFFKSSEKNVQIVPFLKVPIFAQRQTFLYFSWCIFNLHALTNKKIYSFMGQIIKIKTGEQAEYGAPLCTGLCLCDVKFKGIHSIPKYTFSTDLLRPLNCNRARYAAMCSSRRIYFNTLQSESTAFLDALWPKARRGTLLTNR